MPAPTRLRPCPWRWSGAQSMRQCERASPKDYSPYPLPFAGRTHGSATVNGSPHPRLPPQQPKNRQQRQSRSRIRTLRQFYGAQLPINRSLQSRPHLRRRRNLHPLRLLHRLRPQVRQHPRLPHPRLPPQPPPTRLKMIPTGQCYVAENRLQGRSNKTSAHRPPRRRHPPLPARSNSFPQSRMLLAPSRVLMPTASNRKRRRNSVLGCWC